MWKLKYLNSKFNIILNMFILKVGIYLTNRGRWKYRLTSFLDKLWMAILLKAYKIFKLSDKRIIEFYKTVSFTVS